MTPALLGDDRSPGYLYGAAAGIAEQWTGAGWRVLATSNDPGTTDSALFAVACKSAAA